MIPQINEAQREHFWARVKRGPPEECWPWMDGRMGKGYGSVNFDNIQYFTHIIAFYLHIDIWPSERCILHICDNRICCNPSHLTDGSISDNNKDMFQKGRNRSNPNYGSQHHNSVLSDDDVREMKKLGFLLNPTELSKLPRFKDKVSRRNIAYILEGKAWSHIQ